MFLTITSFAQIESAEPCVFIGDKLERPASSFCEPSLPYSGSIDPNVLAAYPPVSYNLQIWINNKSDGTHDREYTIAQFKEKADDLKQQFSIANICLNLVAIDTVNNSSSYDSPSRYSFQNWARQNGYHNSSALNLYVYKGRFRGSAGTTNANINIMSFLDDSGVIGHEVGHLFELEHTHGADYGEDANWWSGPPCESVTRLPEEPGFNAFCKGDFVLDTNAVPDLRYEQQYEKIDSLMTNFSYTFSQAKIVVDSIGYQWNKYLDPITMEYFGDGEDCYGTPYTITPEDATNLMAYADWKKMDHFSIGQAIRMREYIESKPAKFNPITNTEGVDLMITNSLNDIGAEPDIHSNMILWNGPDIWVRNQPDGFTVQENQNAEYDPNNPVYVYVRVRNKSCEDFTATPSDSLKLHWAKANISLGWPILWDGSTSNPTLGEPITAKNLPDISAGESEIVEFEWYPPNPNDFVGINSNPWHFCLLARILSPQDPMNVPEQAGQNNAYHNNNIANKNISLVDLNEDLGEEPGGTVLIGNPVKTYPVLTEFEFFPPQNDPHPILDEAEVIVTLDDHTWNLWVAGGKQSTAIREVKGGGNKLRILSEDAKISNIKFGGKEWGTMHLSFNFLTEEVTNKPNYLYHLKQIESESGTVTGGESYEIIPKFNRLMFMAQGDQINNTTNQTSILQATAINEPAIYNWYDEEGNLMHSGQQLNVNSAIAQTYKLEIIAESDGYKDYTNIFADGSYKLQSLSPNPANSNVLINYLMNGATSAYISITSTQNSISNNYILDVNTSSVNIDVATYPAGTYVVALTCNGEIVATKNLIIQ